MRENWKQLNCTRILTTTRTRDHVGSSQGAVARLWNRKVCGGAELVRKTDIVCGAGAAAVLNNTFACTCEVGEAVLIPAPYYAAFENDMEVLSGLRPVKVVVGDVVRGPTTEEWEAAWAGAKALGLEVGAILVTNPNNPVGVCYRCTVVEEALKWARAKSLFIIVDEIYALSIHGDEGEKVGGGGKGGTSEARSERREEEALLFL